MLTKRELARLKNWSLKPGLRAEESQATLNMPTSCHVDNPPGTHTNHCHACGNRYLPPCSTDSPCSSRRFRSNCLAAVALRIYRQVAAGLGAQAATAMTVLWADWVPVAVVSYSAPAFVGLVLPLAGSRPPRHSSRASAAAVLQRGRCCLACSCFCSLPNQGLCSSTSAWDLDSRDYLCSFCMRQSTAPWAATPHIATHLGQRPARPVNTVSRTAPSLYCGQNRSYSHPCSTCSPNSCRHCWRIQAASSVARTRCCHGATRTLSIAGPQLHQKLELRGQAQLQL
mmetsp:Transcript_107567/g.213658  ORF Transcript_107567/g.213658 Transcript_107567/m.213658 type:complete len:284 (+) Transcript_107567:1436-2287(+)